MRKGLIGLVILAVVIILSVFLMIPRELFISNVTTIRSSQNGVWRNLSDPARWSNWWPGNRAANPAEGDKTYSYNGYHFKLNRLLYNMVEIGVEKDGVVSNGKMVMIPVATDSIVVQWNNSLSASNNPFDRLQKFFRGREIKKTVDVVLDSLKAFNEDKNRMYRFNIHHTTLKDTSLVATKKITNDYPSTVLIYQMIDHLKEYIAKEGAKETHFPMLNISKSENGTFRTMVAIATDRKLNGEGDIEFKRFIIYKDKVLTADVFGGPGTIRQAYEEIETYMSDYHLQVPVIHFEYLETNRLKEADTSKWVTRIYFPII